MTYKIYWNLSDIDVMWKLYLENLPEVYWYQFI